MRWLIVLAIVLAPQPVKAPERNRIAGGAPPVISQQANGSQDNQKGSEKSSGATQGSYSDANASQCDENIRIQRKLVLFTELLVIAGFATAGVIVWQSWETRKAAEAASLNAEALIRAERPWLLVEVIINEHDPQRWIIRAINKGRTPAEMYEGHCECKVRPVQFRPPDDLVAPFYAPLQRVTVSGEGFEIMRITPAAFNAVYDSSTEPAALMVYGRILYRNMFTDRTDTNIHETRWCFAFHPQKGWLQTANGYAKNT